MGKIENSNMGKDCKLIAASVEKDLVARIDQLAHRDRITRSTWMREALIRAWRRSEEFRRTPLHGYLTTPIEIPSARVAEEPQQTKKAKRRS